MANPPPSDDPTVWDARGQRLLAQRRDEEALLAFDRALARDPHAVPTLIHKAQALYRLGRAAEELPVLDAALALAPDDANA